MINSNRHDSQTGVDKRNLPLIVSNEDECRFFLKKEQEERESMHLSNEHNTCSDEQNDQKKNLSPIFEDEFDVSYSCVRNCKNTQNLGLFRKEKYEEAVLLKQSRFDDLPRDLKESGIVSSAHLNSVPTTPKTLREVYVGNLPNGLTVAQLLEFINKSMLKNSALALQGNPVISAWINSDGKYAFCECRSVDEANTLLKFNNTLNLNGNLLRIGKPKIIEQGSILDSTTSNSTINSTMQGTTIISSYFNNIPLLLIRKETIILSGIHKSHSLFSIKEYFKNDGKVEVLELLNYYNKYKIAICEIDSSINTLERIKRKLDKVKILKLKDLTQNDKLFNFINDNLLIEIENSINNKNSTNLDKEERSLKEIIPSLMIPHRPSRCIVISKILNIDELVSNIYDSIYNEIKEECSKFGEVVKILIPRPQKALKSTEKQIEFPYGKVFILYRKVESAIKATMNLYKMRFLGRNLKINYYSELEFLQGNFVSKDVNKHIVIEENLFNDLVGKILDF